jgi:hypothetical protein
MSTVQNIIDWVNRKYPNHGESVANLIKDLNDIHKEVHTKISRVKNERETWSFLTVNDPALPSYDLAEDCTIDLITSVQISKIINPASANDYNTFEYAGINDDISNGYYYYDAGVNPNTGRYMIGLSIDGDIIETADLESRIYYTKRANELNFVTDTPNLNSDYHTLLKYALVSSVASQGNNPDTEIADFYQRKFDEFFKDIQDDIAQRYNQTANKLSQSEEHW